jgi:hypothetical protein
VIRKTASEPLGRILTESQIGAIRAAMHLFVEEDAGRDSARGRVYCDACEHPQPAAGSIRYGRYQICNACATDYEIAHARGLVGSMGQFVRDRQFGEQIELLVGADAEDEA